MSDLLTSRPVRIEELSYHCRHPGHQSNHIHGLLTLLNVIRVVGTSFTGSVRATCLCYDSACMIESAGGEVSETVDNTGGGVSETVDNTGGGVNATVELMGGGWIDHEGTINKTVENMGGVGEGGSKETTG